MRCPKCGFISFDKEESCAKCDASLAEISRSLGGTAVRVQESFFLTTILGQAGQHAVSNEIEFDLAEAEALPESDVEIAMAEDEEGIPMVDLSPFEQQDGAGFEEEEQPAEELGATDFGVDEELAQEEELQPAAEETLEHDFALEEAGGEEALEQLGRPVLKLEEEAEEALPDLQLEMGSEAEESLELDDELQSDIEEQALAEELGAGKTAAAIGSGLNFDIDADLEEDEPSEEEMVFNLEDIDMSDLVIDESLRAEGEAGRPEDTALDLEDFLNGGKGSDIPMDLTMEDIDLGDNAKNKKSANLPDVEL